MWKKSETGSLSHTIIKLISGELNLSVYGKTLTFLAENKRFYLYDFGAEKDLTKEDTKSTNHQENINKSAYIKMNIYSLRDTIKIVKICITKWKTVFGTNKTDR